MAGTGTHGERQALESEFLTGTIGDARTIRILFDLFNPDAFDQGNIVFFPIFIGAENQTFFINLALQELLR